MIFSKLLHETFCATLEMEQSCGQTGFRPHTGIEDAFVFFETACRKIKKWNCPVWFASLDLRKAFDRIEFESFFEALQQHQCQNRIAFFYGACIGTNKGSGGFFLILNGVSDKVM
jgi:hypothetical protein